MSCCGEQPKAIIIDDELRGMIKRLRERRDSLRGGDGFTHAGTLIGAYKRTLAQMESLVMLEETAPVEEKCEFEEQANPDCLGRGSDNTPGCTCRLVFESIGENDRRREAASTK